MKIRELYQRLPGLDRDLMYNSYYQGYSANGKRGTAAECRARWNELMEMDESEIPDSPIIERY